MQSEREPTDDAAVPLTDNNGSPIRMYDKNWMPDCQYAGILWQENASG